MQLPFWVALLVLAVAYCLFVWFVLRVFRKTSGRP